mmetsp:Transcript_4493/g.17682  ORF Transcript_4493/g.17682 Transcript_4493/m.17682 type:complete len:215 (+) Transcript_4493:522-1166(+)
MLNLGEDIWGPAFRFRVTNLSAGLKGGIEKIPSQRCFRRDFCHNSIVDTFEQSGNAEKNRWSDFIKVLQNLVIALRNANCRPSGNCRVQFTVLAIAMSPRKKRQRHVAWTNDVGLIVGKDLTDTSNVACQVAMGKLYAFRHAGRPRSVYQRSEIIWFASMLRRRWISSVLRLGDVKVKAVGRLMRSIEGENPLDLPNLSSKALRLVIDVLARNK